MKREYAKPFLAVESFQLDAAIAGACSDKNLATLNHTITTCMALDTGYFSTNCYATGIDVTDDDYDDNYCYQGPINDVGTFYLYS